MTADKQEVAGWLTTARANAGERLSKAGMPTKRDEYWKYTNPSRLTAEVTEPAAVFTSDEDPMFDQIDRLKLVFVDGVFDAGQSDDLTLSGVTIEHLSALTQDTHWARNLFGVLEEKGQTPVSRPMAVMNTAKAVEGFAIHVSAKVSKPIAIRYIHAEEASDAFVHHVIKLEEGTEATILESGAGAARFNSVLEVDVADKAAFHHVRTQGRDHDRKTATHMFARIGEESEYKSFTMTMNGVLTRNETVIEILGDNSQATVAGTAAGDGSSFHHDDTVFVTHDSVNCESRQVFKKVLRNGATGVFQGKILVQPDAQKTDGYQISQALLLDEDSTFLAKPELEIYADDVACSHGSTVGAIDDDALFYLKSRGVPTREAQDMLVLAFLGEAIDEIANEDLADEIRDRLANWMARRHS